MLFGDDLSKKLTEAAGARKLRPKKANYKQFESKSYKKPYQNSNYFPKNWEGLRKSHRKSSIGVPDTKFQVVQHCSKEELPGIEVNLKNNSHVNISVLQADVLAYRGGNIKNHFDFWQKITADKFILDIVRYGLKLEFKHVIPEQKSHSPLQFNSKKEEAIEIEIQKLLDKSIIEECDSCLLYTSPSPRDS